MVKDNPFEKDVDIVIIGIIAIRSIRLLRYEISNLTLIKQNKDKISLLVTKEVENSFAIQLKILSLRTRLIGINTYKFCNFGSLISIHIFIIFA